MSIHGADLFGEVVEKKHTSKLGDEFMIPPFSVMSAREGWWQERKRAWLAMGIQSELGRGQERLEMAHPATTATIDFYAQKRAIEAEQGRSMTTQEARDILAAKGLIVDDRAGNAARLAAKEGDLVIRDQTA